MYSKIFRKKNRRPSEKYQLTSLMAVGLQFLQQNWARTMHHIFSKISIKNQRILFCLLALILTTYCSWLIFQAFRPGNMQQHPNASIHLPELIPPDQRQDSLFRKDLNTQIKAFRHYADSLKRIGGKDWQQFNQQYGSLVDSIALLP